MRTITRRHLLGTAAGLALVLSAGAAEAAGTIALVTINQQALFFNQINDGAQAAADRNGVKLVIFNANNQPTAQNTRDRELHHRRRSTASSSSPST